MVWAELLLVANIVGAALLWLGRNDWSYRYVGSVWRRLRRLLTWLMPWSKTNRLIEQVLAEVKTTNGESLRLALEHLNDGLNSVQSALAMLHVRQRMYDRLLDNATLTCDADGRVVWASDGMLALAQTSLDDFIGENWINALHQDDRTAVMNGWVAAVKAGRDFSVQYRYHATATTPERKVEAHAYAARAHPSDRPVGWVAIVRPIPATAGEKLRAAVEPNLSTARLRLDAERRCYMPEMGQSDQD